MKVKVEKMLIPSPDIRVLQVTVVGTSPLIVHRFSEKARKQIEDTQGKRARKAREVRDPQAEYEAACYHMPRGKFGFKANAFKLAMVDACAFCQGITKVFAKGAFFVMGDLLEIKGGKPKMRTDIVRVPPGPRGSADMRYRPEWEKWSIDLQIRYNAHLIAAEQLVNLLTLAGLHVGIGEQRPSSPNKAGSNGMFVVKARKPGRKARAA